MNRYRTRNVTIIMCVLIVFSISLSSCNWRNKRQDNTPLFGFTSDAGENKELTKNRRFPRDNPGALTYNRAKLPSNRKPIGTTIEAIVPQYKKLPAPAGAAPTQPNNTFVGPMASPQQPSPATTQENSLFGNMMGQMNDLFRTTPPTDTQPSPMVPDIKPPQFTAPSTTAPINPPVMPSIPYQQNTIPPLRPVLPQPSFTPQQPLFPIPQKNIPSTNEDIPVFNPDEFSPAPSLDTISPWTTQSNDAAPPNYSTEPLPQLHNNNSPYWKPEQQDYVPPLPTPVDPYSPPWQPPAIAPYPDMAPPVSSYTPPVLPPHAITNPDTIAPWIQPQPNFTSPQQPTFNQPDEGLYWTPSDTLPPTMPYTDDAPLPWQPPVINPQPGNVMPMPNAFSPSIPEPSNAPVAPLPTPNMLLPTIPEQGVTLFKPLHLAMSSSPDFPDLRSVPSTPIEIQKYQQQLDQQTKELQEQQKNIEKKRDAIHDGESLDMQTYPTPDNVS